MMSLLSDVAEYVNEKISMADFDNSQYISTDSMLKNRCGITSPESIPTSGKVSRYQPKDILVSNIRPYFKKIWYADRIGGCSNDVIVFRAKSNIDSLFLYYVLSDDCFFEHMMTGANGTKMPRGNKKLIPTFAFNIFDLPTQKTISKILSRYDRLIQNYRRQILLLEESAQRSYKKWFIDLQFPGYKNVQFVDGIPCSWTKKRISDVCELSAGKDKPSIVSDIITKECNIPIYSNGITDEGLYGYTPESRIDKESVTISARGTIGYAFLRLHPYVPIVRLLVLVPKENISAKFIYLWASQKEIRGNGAAQQQLTVPLFKNEEILIPDPVTMNEFALLMDRQYNKIDNLQSQIKLLTEARDRLLPKLMNGEIKV